MKIQNMLQFKVPRKKNMLKYYFKIILKLTAISKITLITQYRMTQDVI